eukprot:TRINITY_DN5932_c0_g1_i1.p1 TRINITY_DN5932_c0_g1~~TRINITY_DN5932_c0_g1_i1.p1  ORF type:complete len:569 (+),score=186.81 TRINITY_DN5932_c0_g1_i1:64-1770(+)
MSSKKAEKTIDLVSSDEEEERGRGHRTVELRSSSSSSEEGPDEVSDAEEDEQFVTGISSPGKVTPPVTEEEEESERRKDLVTSTPATHLGKFRPKEDDEEIFESLGTNEEEPEELLEELSMKHQRGVASRLLESTMDSTLREKGDMDETLESKASLANTDFKRKREGEDLLALDRANDVSQNASLLQNESLLNASTRPNFDLSDLKARNLELSSFMPSQRPEVGDPLDNSSSETPSVNRSLASPNKRVRKSEVDPSLLPKTCRVLRTDTAIVYLVGTAHFSKESQEDVQRTIAAAQPDVIMLELCKARTNVFQMDEETILREVTSMGVRQVLDVIKRDGAVRGTLALLLQNLSAYLTKELGMAPGGEFRTAWREAKKIPGCLIHLGDRPIGVTLQRALGALSLWQKLHLGFHLLCTNESFTKEDVEKCKEKDMLESMLEEMTGEFPALTKVFIDERDLFLAHSLQIAGSHSLLQHRRLNTLSPHSEPPLFTGDDPAVVVGVVGLGHVDGILKVWDQVSPEDVARVMKIPIPSASEIVTRKIFKFGFYSLMAYGAYRLLRGPISKVLKH